MSTTKYDLIDFLAFVNLFHFQGEYGDNAEKDCGIWLWEGEFPKDVIHYTYIEHISR